MVSSCSRAVLLCPSVAGLYFLAAATIVAATDQGHAPAHAKLRWLSAINPHPPRA